MAKKAEEAKKTEEVKQETKAITQEDVKAKVYEVLIAKASDMLKGPDRVNDPHTMEAMATLYNAIK